MESFQAYFHRKHEEARLLASFLVPAPTMPRPHSVEAVIEQKFRLAAALKAERALAAWSRSETSWAGASVDRIGPYNLRSSYQRADLTVAGPAIYGPPRQVGFNEVSTIYAASGMSSLSTLLLALGRTLPGARLTVPAGTYSETLEVITHFGAGLHLDERVSAINRLPDRTTPRQEPRILLIDSSVSAHALFPSEGGCGDYDFILFDTTCLWPGSGRIRQVLRWVACIGSPVVLVRSHSKLDSLGIEYGRLGSAVLLAPAQADLARVALLEQLEEEIKRAVRLFGAAPVPAHFPPFAGHPCYAVLSAVRIARMIANGRRMVHNLIRQGVPILIYGHGLYGVLQAHRSWDLEDAKQVASHLVEDLRAAVHPVRYSGSFGFDFVALDGFPNPAGSGASRPHGVRLAFADIPTQVADELSDRIARWWRANILSQPSRRRVA